MVIGSIVPSLQQTTASGLDAGATFPNLIGYLRQFFIASLISDK